MVVSITLTISAILALVEGILILVFPKFLRIGVGLYLIIVGVLQLLNTTNILTSP